jgi:hypothetical protein
MSRSLVWAMLIAAGLVLGYAFGSHDASRAASPQAAEAAETAAEDANTAMMQQLKEVNSHLARIDTLLASGRLRVVQVINPDASR